MGFFKTGETPTKKGSAPNDQEIELADLVRESTQKEFRYRSAARAVTWAKVIRLIVRDQQGNAGRVRKVLKWYARNCGKIAKPRITSPTQLRKCFSWLAELRAKDHTTVKVSPDAQRVLRHVEHMGWPKGSKEQLGAFIQKSLEGIMSFRGALGDWLLTQGDGGKVGKAAKEATDRMGGDRNFATTWVKMTHERVANWDDWSGDLMAYVFHPKHKMFTELGRGWMRSYCGDAVRWDALIEELYAS
jgi:hypothetical protein